MVRRTGISFGKKFTPVNEIKHDVEIGFKISNNFVISIEFYELELKTFPESICSKRASHQNVPQYPSASLTAVHVDEF